MPQEKKTDRVSVFVRLCLAADRAIDERAAQMGNVTRSLVVETAIERFVKNTLAHNPSFVKHPACGETVVRKFKIEPRIYELLAQAQQAHGYSYQEMIRHAVGELTGIY
jgi:hypothetical protein